MSGRYLREVRRQTAAEDLLDWGAAVAGVRSAVTAACAAVGAALATVAPVRGRPRGILPVSAVRVAVRFAFATVVAPAPAVSFALAFRGDLIPRDRPLHLDLFALQSVPAERVATPGQRESDETSAKSCARVVTVGGRAHCPIWRTLAIASGCSNVQNPKPREWPFIASFMTEASVW